ALSTLNSGFADHAFEDVLSYGNGAKCLSKRSMMRRVNKLSQRQKKEGRMEGVKRSAMGEGNQEDELTCSLNVPESYIHTMNTILEIPKRWSK
ncbi:hypothetical protein KIN20_031062, partial [Parelaphostrongylus tenuis]